MGSLSNVNQKQLYNSQNWNKSGKCGARESGVGRVGRAVKGKLKKRGSPEPINQLFFHSLTLLSLFFFFLKNHPLSWAYSGSLGCSPALVGAGGFGSLCFFQFSVRSRTLQKPVVSLRDGADVFRGQSSPFVRLLLFVCESSGSGGGGGAVHPANCINWEALMTGKKKKNNMFSNG